MRTLMIQKIKGLCTLVYDPRSAGAPGKNRTCGTWIRNPLLYPLSYGGIQTVGKKPECIHKRV